MSGLLHKLEVLQLGLGQTSLFSCGLTLICIVTAEQKRKMPEGVYLGSVK